MDKDIVTVLTIPLVLAAIFLLVDNANSGITGFAALQQNDNFESATYTVNPSFSIKDNYNLEQEYASSVNTIKGIVSTCEKTSDIRKCIMSEADKFKCPQNEKENIFYSFVDRYIECLELQEKDALCLFTLGEAEAISNEQDYVFKIEEGSYGVRFALLKSANDKKSLIEDYVDSAGPHYTDFSTRGRRTPAAGIEVRIKHHKDGKISVEGAAANLMQQGQRTGVSFNHNGKFMLYKGSDKSGSFLSFVPRDEEDKFVLFYQSNKRIEELPKKKAAKFCIRSSSNKKVIAYDLKDDKIMQRNIYYKLAITYPELEVPLPLKGIKAEDKKNAENSILLSWKRAEDSSGNPMINIEHYNVYCSDSKKDFEDVNDNGEIIFKLKPSFEVRSINSENPETWKIVAGKSDKCNSDEIKENEEYFFSITAVTKQNAEGTARLSDLASAKSSDDLAPGIVKVKLSDSLNANAVERDFSDCRMLPAQGSIVFSNMAKPLLNADGSKRRQEENIDGYYVHYKKDTAVLDNLDNCEQNKCIKYNNAQSIRFDKDTSTNDAFGKMQEGSTYCFTSVAVDGSGNAVKKLVMGVNNRLIPELEEDKQSENLEKFVKQQNI